LSPCRVRLEALVRMPVLDTGFINPLGSLQHQGIK
jgi:hypothetical protein